VDKSATGSVNFFGPTPLEHCRFDKAGVEHLRAWSAEHERLIRAALKELFANCALRWFGPLERRGGTV
jgi:hypothetical protein